jgi:predicted negative regulator of RcsB-dependent stress response
MFKLYGSDEEHIAALRNWWKDHGKQVIFAGIAVTIIGITYQQYHQWSLHRTLHASHDFQSYLIAPKTSPHLSEPFQAPAALAYAQSLIVEDRINEALQQLVPLMHHKIAAIANSATYLAGTLYLQMKEWEKATQAFTLIADTEFKPLALEGLGDIALLQQDYQHAADHYKQAQLALPKGAPWRMIEHTLTFKEQQAITHATN